MCVYTHTHTYTYILEVEFETLCQLPKGKYVTFTFQVAGYDRPFKRNFIKRGFYIDAILQHPEIQQSFLLQTRLCRTQ